MTRPFVSAADGRESSAGTDGCQPISQYLMNWLPGLLDAARRAQGWQPHVSATGRNVIIKQARPHVAP